MKTCTLNGQKYYIDVAGPIDGCCDQINSNTPTIMLCRDLSTLAGLNTSVHESLHACFPGASEEKVTQSGNDIARLLWGLGYRYVKSKGGR